MLQVHPGHSASSGGSTWQPMLVQDGMAAAPNCCIDRATRRSTRACWRRMVRDTPAAIEASAAARIATRSATPTALHRRAPVRPDARRHGNHGMSEQPAHAQTERHGRPELRRLERRRPAPDLEGEANDYVGKGMAGGKIWSSARRGCQLRRAQRHDDHRQHLSVRRHRRRVVRRRRRWRALRVRNRRDGRRRRAGDHGCELRPAAWCWCSVAPAQLRRRFFTGGFAFVLDEDATFVDRYNHGAGIDIHRISTEAWKPPRTCAN